MQTIRIKNGEIRTSELNSIIQNEVNPETIQFIVQNTSIINNVENLNYSLLYLRDSEDYGSEPLTKFYSNGILYLNWNMSKEFTDKKGSVKIQIYGKTADNKIRWSTKPSQIYLIENISHQAETELVPDFVSEYLSNTGDS